MNVKTKKKTKKSKKTIRNYIIVALVLILCYAYTYRMQQIDAENEDISEAVSFSLSQVPEYSGQPAFVVNGNRAYFTAQEIVDARDKGSFKSFGNLDSLGRCTGAYCNIGRDLMPDKNEKRGDISSIHPSGWHQRRYDCVDSETVMTRSHLAAWMFTGENDNVKNLVSGTRYFNSDTMLYYEQLVSSYIYKSYGNHVLYRVTPVFKGSELMPRGVLMEAYSVEDAGFGIQYCVFVYNVQPGIKFNYSNGWSDYTGIFFDTKSDTVSTNGIKLGTFVMDIPTGTVHSISCDKPTQPVIFSGDVSMMNTWNLCSCLK